MEEGYVYPRGFASKFNVVRSIAQVIPTNVWTLVEWNLEYFDLLDEMLIVNPWTFTPKQAGYYFLYAQARIVDLTIPARLQLYFFLNGAQAIGGINGENTNINEDVSLNLSNIPYLTPNDVVDVRVWHNNGINRSLFGNLNENRFFGYRIG